VHHELPERLDLDWYRQRARDLLRAYHANDADARERVGQRDRFRLADAQHVIAFEHGYRNWAQFKRWLQTRSPEPPVGRIGRAPLQVYHDRAQELIDRIAAGDDDALRRIRANVPRLADFRGRDLLLEDARLVVAREYGFPTGRDLLFYAQKAIDEYEHRPKGPLGLAFELIGHNDIDGLRRMLDADPKLVHAKYRGAATTMLEAVAQPDIFGENLGVELGIDPRIVELLVERGSDLEGPLNLAACFNRAELVRMLLAAGAAVDDTQTWGITPLQTAVYHGSREAADLLAAVAVVPDALYVAAGGGRLDSIEHWFLADGSLRTEALLLRPNLSDVGWPAAPPPRPDVQDALDEAFALAAFSGRLDVMALLLERGADVNGSVHLGLTALHLAVIRRRLETMRWLVEHGGDVGRRDDIHHRSVLAWAEHIFQNTPEYELMRGIARKEGESKA
jgi:Ankyrin repeats (many copies)